MEHSDTPVIPTNDDILCGSGNMKSAHPGNQQLKQIVMKHFTEYKKAETKRKMMEISKRILLEASSRGARFLWKHPIFDEWYVQEDPKAVRDKISHMLRDLKRTTKTRPENRLRGPANTMIMNDGGCSEQAQRNLVRVAPMLMVKSDTTVKTNDIIAKNLTSFLNWHHDPSATSILGEEWKRNDFGDTISLHDHNAEQQHEVESLYSVLELILGDDWEFLP